MSDAHENVILIELNPDEVDGLYDGDSVTVNDEFGDVRAVVRLSE